VVLLNQLVHPVPWSVKHHYGRCGQSCVCCRAHNADDVEWSGCDVCHLGWLMTIVTRWTKECTQLCCSKQQPIIIRKMSPAPLLLTASSSSDAAPPQPRWLTDSAEPGAAAPTPPAAEPKERGRSRVEGSSAEPQSGSSTPRVRSPLPQPDWLTDGAEARAAAPPPSSGAQRRAQPRGSPSP